MLILQENDPFHFGTVGRSVFTVLRLETADSWDQILYINLYGCDQVNIPGRPYGLGRALESISFAPEVAAFLLQRHPLDANH